ncbi:hypothetical protein E2562_032009 [Oryza meyeriana var. granulata]|uniref:Uncharacterized protein n=1 Tax=Oryza meyeriana var. granulata TaxID=110450 RepID=A0A6G1FEM8_9ORYZ|nr:hypothetical protein E2562_032009 [Oryza meyeriana var. granulata]
MAAMMAVTTMVTRTRNNAGGALAVDRKGWFIPELAFPWSSAEGECNGNRLEFPRRAPPPFASVGLNVSAAAEPAVKGRDNCDVARQLAAAEEAEEAAAGKKKKQGKKKLGRGLLALRKVRVKIGNPHIRRLVSGAIAGAVSRTFVAPLETIRTHLMVGSCGAGSMAEVFRWIVRNEGWTGLFRGNAVNVLRVAPSKAIEHFTYDTAKKYLTTEDGELAKIPIPTPLVAGALAGVASTLCTYPMELVKTRLTIEKDLYDNVLHAFVKIVREGGPSELYRGLAPSLIGVVPYAATNFYAYETLRRLYRRATGRAEVGPAATLLIGSAAGAIASTATFPLEVARKQMQVGAVGGRQVYRNVLHAMYCILRSEGAAGLYRGLGPSCIKLMPAAGISFMCYEALKKILVEDAPALEAECVEDDEEENKEKVA